MGQLIYYFLNDLQYLFSDFQWMISDQIFETFITKIITLWPKFQSVSLIFIY